MILRGHWPPHLPTPASVELAGLFLASMEMALAQMAEVIPQRTNLKEGILN